MWKIPKQIVTPNLEADISRLLSTEILQLFRQCTDDGKFANGIMVLSDERKNSLYKKRR